MLKLMICCRRTPGFTREQFFDHLRHIHWPLLQATPSVLQMLTAYVQNHAVLDLPDAMAPFACARDRDSVIEVTLESAQRLEDLVNLPDYQELIRPDEHRFNDLAHNILMRSSEQTDLRLGAVGRCKRFDFIACDGETDPARLKDDIRDQTRHMLLDPSYTARVDRHVDNFADPVVDGLGFGQGHYVCIREVWSHSFTSLADVADVSRIRGADPASFSVFATEFVKRGALQH